MVLEATSLAQVPVADVSVYCDACGEVGHTFATTDANGAYRFSGVLARGGGIWVNGSPTSLLVRKDGYAVQKPSGTFPDGTGTISVMVRGDTTFDIVVVKR